MRVLRSGQSGGLEVLQLLRRSVAPSTAPRIVPALRDREPGKSDRLLLVQRPAPGTQVFASPALPGVRRHGDSHRWIPPLRVTLHPTRCSTRATPLASAQSLNVSRITTTRI